MNFSLSGPCHGPVCMSPASNRGDLGKILGRSIQNLCWSKWQWDRCFFREGFPFQYLRSLFHSHL